MEQIEIQKTMSETQDNLDNALIHCRRQLKMLLLCYGGALFVAGIFYIQVIGRIDKTAFFFICGLFSFFVFSYVIFLVRRELDLELLRNKYKIDFAMLDFMEFVKEEVNDLNKQRVLLMDSRLKMTNEILQSVREKIENMRT